jgi:hypothetical protein
MSRTKVLATSAYETSMEDVSAKDIASKFKIVEGGPDR